GSVDEAAAGGALLAAMWLEMRMCWLGPPRPPADEAGGWNGSSDPPAETEGWTGPSDPPAETGCCGWTGPSDPPAETGWCDSPEPPAGTQGWTGPSDPPAETEGWCGSPEPPAGTEGWTGPSDPPVGPGCRTAARKKAGKRGPGWCGEGEEVLPKNCQSMGVSPLKP
uniref:Uncharacterized protein n=1 Tax=Oreochromis aureus TaxID=47969 RepID=A0AAZ1XI85_OREAU